MEASTTIRKMMAGNKIVVPSYQRAYSWDSPDGSKQEFQTQVFLSDLEEYIKSGTDNPYYFGHFLFKQKKTEKGRVQEFEVIDGQQRLTTIVIFLSALFNRLEKIRNLAESELFCREDMIKRGEELRFFTVDYDRLLFTDYVIRQTRIDIFGVETESGRRIIRAFDFFREELSQRSEEDLVSLLLAVSEATCSTHLVQSESDAIQMFIFQNNRGKKPSKLEVIKALFMYNVHLYGGENDDIIIEEIKGRFETIYKSISSIEYRLNEDDVLRYALQVYLNSLWETDSENRIKQKLADQDRMKFIREFSKLLENCFKYLQVFFGEHERLSFSIHSLISLGRIGIAIPFILKAYKFNLPITDIEKICSSLESLILRHALTGTRAELRSRINDIYQTFNDEKRDFEPVIKRIDFLKNTKEWWWAYWNNNELEKSIQGDISHSIAKYLLWKYENHLMSRGKAGYGHLRFDKIEQPELEHIAPTTEPQQKPHGYDNYDDEFRNQYVNCLGNYLLLSRAHNRSIHNDPFPEKHKDYTFLEQQREIRNLVPDPQKGTWNRTLIKSRKEKIVQFVMENL